MPGRGGGLWAFMRLCEYLWWFVVPIGDDFWWFVAKMVAFGSLEVCGEMMKLW